MRHFLRLRQHLQYAVAVSFLSQLYDIEAALQLLSCYNIQIILRTKV